MCCELLSKVCIFVVWNNCEDMGIFKILLWIAFKSLYLCSLKQLEDRDMEECYGCELLSKVCIFVVWNNNGATVAFNESVVNCFQKFVSL